MAVDMKSQRRSTRQGKHGGRDMTTKKPKRAKAVRIIPLRKAGTEADILQALSVGIWEQRTPKERCPDNRIASPEKLADWMQAPDDVHILEEVQKECAKRLAVCFGEDEEDVQWAWMPVEDRGKKGAVLLDLILVRARPGGVPQLYQDGIVHAHKKWLAARLAAESADPEAKDLPVHPLTPLVRAWQAQKYSAKPERRTQGILPSTFAPPLPNAVSKILAMLPPPSQLGRVDLGVTGEGHLPALDPAGGEETPALLLGLFDRHFGPLRKGPTNQPFAPVEVRVFLELLLSTPADARNGLRQSLGPFTIREIVGDWLGWDLRHYRPQGRWTGIMLAEGLSKLHNLVIPIGLTGGYFPVRLDRYSGLALDDKIYFDVRLPAGAGVGPPVDRLMLRGVGCVGARSYRAYMGLLFEWDKYGGRKGKLVRATRPLVRRNANGEVLGKEGEVLLNTKGKPEVSSYASGAVALGGREPNPAVELRYPLYDQDELLRLCYPPGILSDIYKSTPAKRRDAARRARESVESLEEMGACLIERTGARLPIRGGKRMRNVRPRMSPGLPWRILPPDRFCTEPVQVPKRTGSGGQMTIALK